MKEHPIIMTGESVRAILDGRKAQTRRAINPGLYLQCIDPEENDNLEVLLACCPYGRAGGRLWVRETWCAMGRDEQIAYRADGLEYSHWRPSIFMPRWASRLTLEIVSVRVERVQDISDDDALAEGVDQRHKNHAPPSQRFASLWDSINAKRGYGWTVNPWVWVLEFRAVTP